MQSGRFRSIVLRGAAGTLPALFFLAAGRSLTLVPGSRSGLCFFAAFHWAGIHEDIQTKNGAFFYRSILVLRRGTLRVLFCFFRGMWFCHVFIFLE